MAATRKTRQAADPSIRVADLQDCIEQWLAAYGTRNVPTLLTKLEGASWKTAPIPAALASLQPLLTCLRWFQLQVITLFAIKQINHGFAIVWFFGNLQKKLPKVLQLIGNA